MTTPAAPDLMTPPARANADQFFLQSVDRKEFEKQKLREERQAEYNAFLRQKGGRDSRAGDHSDPRGAPPPGYGGGHAVPPRDGGGGGGGGDVMGRENYHQQLPAPRKFGAGNALNKMQGDEEHNQREVARRQYAAELEMQIREKKMREDAERANERQSQQALIRQREAGPAVGMGGALMAHADRAHHRSPASSPTGKGPPPQRGGYMDRDMDPRGGFDAGARPPGQGATAGPRAQGSAAGSTAS